MTLRSLAQSLTAPFSSLVQLLPARKTVTPFAPVTFEEMQERKREIYGNDGERTPCACPQCRQNRKTAG